MIKCICRGFLKFFAVRSKTSKTSRAMQENSGKQLMQSPSVAYLRQCSSRHNSRSGPGRFIQGVFLIDNFFDAVKLFSDLDENRYVCHQGIYECFVIRIFKNTDDNVVFCSRTSRFDQSVLCLKLGRGSQNRINR